MKDDVKQLKSVKAEGDPRVEEIIECNIQLACNNSKEKCVSSDVTSSYTTGLAHCKRVAENMEREGNVGGVEAYRVSVQEYNMSTASFVPQTNTYIFSSDPCEQHGFLQQEVPQQSITPVWQDVQQKPYMDAEITSHQQVWISYLSLSFAF